MPCHVIPAADCCHLRIRNELSDSLARYPLDEREREEPTRGLGTHAPRGFINLPPLLGPHSIHRNVNILRGPVVRFFGFNQLSRPIIAN